MKAEDFAAWLSAISGMNEGQRTEAIAALEKARGRGRGGRFCEEGQQAWPPKGRAGNDQSRARRGSGLSSLRGTRGRRLGPLARTFAVSLQELWAHLQCADQDADGASAQEGEMARSRPGDDRGQEPSQDRATVRRSSDDGVPLAPSVSARAGCQQAAKLKRDRRSGRDLRPRILQGPMVRSAAPVPRKRGGKARHPGPYQDNIPVLVARDRKGATFDAVLPQVDGASIGRALAGVVTQDNHLIGDGGRPIATFARRAGIPFHAVLAPGKPAPQAPHLHINNVNAYHGRLKQWLNRFNGVATKNLPNYLRWRRASKPGATNSNRQTGSKARSETDHTNS